MDIVTDTDTPRLGRQPWTNADLTVLGGLALMAAAAIGLGAAGVTRIQPVAGLAVILALAYCLSSARRSIDTARSGGACPAVRVCAHRPEDGHRTPGLPDTWLYITKLLNFTYVGSAFVFGPWAIRTSGRVR